MRSASTKSCSSRSLGATCSALLSNEFGALPGAFYSANRRFAAIMTGSRLKAGRSRAMLFDLKQIHGERAHIERTFAPAAFDPQDPDYRVTSPVRLSMDVEKAGSDTFRVTGHVVAQLELECGRCVE